MAKFVCFLIIIVIAAILFVLESKPNTEPPAPDSLSLAPYNSSQILVPSTTSEIRQSNRPDSEVATRTPLLTPNPAKITSLANRPKFDLASVPRELPVPQGGRVPIVLAINNSNLGSNEYFTPAQKVTLNRMALDFAKEVSNDCEDKTSERYHPGKASNPILHSTKGSTDEGLRELARWEKAAANLDERFRSAFGQDIYNREQSRRYWLTQ